MSQERMKIGVQLYTLRKYLQKPENVRPVFERVAAMGAETVQISAMCKTDAKEIASICRDTGLSVCGTHSPFKDIKNDLDRLAEEHLEFGCKTIGIGMLPSCYDKKNPMSVSCFVDFLNETAEKLKKYDMRVAYHNHWFEFKKVGDRLLYDVLIEDTVPEVAFIPDTFWIKVGGFEPVEYLNKLGDRAVILHLKDWKKVLGVPVFKPVGDGKLDFPKILEAAETNGTNYAVVELDVSRDPYGDLDKSLKYISAIY